MSECPIWDELVDTLYGPDGRRKLEYAIGGQLENRNKRQRFVILEGGPATGKSTVLKIVADLFPNRVNDADMFQYSKLDNQTLRALANMPDFLISHDTDLNKVFANPLFTKVVSREMLAAKVRYGKFKPLVPVYPRSLVLMATSLPYELNDSGLRRRALVLKSTGNRIQATRYDRFMREIVFEEDQAIMARCVTTYMEGLN